MATAVQPNTIDLLFDRCREEHRAALILYMTAGFPDTAITREVLPILAEAGCDLIELGVPFSDPIADGPVIQRASAVALDAGVTYPQVVALARDFRRNHATPLIFFGALNPFSFRGMKEAAVELREIGAQGILAADLPLEESEELRALLAAEGLHLITLIAPTTPERRLPGFAKHCTGFLYCIAYKGTTGTKSAPTESVAEYLARLRQTIKLPLALGFGIRTPQDVRAAVASGADAVVVGTALIEELEAALAAGHGWQDRIRAYVQSLAGALRR
jgi:tryptophan synthase alpha chain